MIIETEKLGHKLSKVTLIMKKFALHKCGHKEPISGSACFKSMIKSNRYIIATQDRELQGVDSKASWTTAGIPSSSNAGS